MDSQDVKTYLQENFERILPKEEDTNHRLVDQMRGYLVKSVTARGDFTYEGEDHVLDAFNLAVYGFYHQFGILLKTSYDNRIKFMQNHRYNEIIAFDNEIRELRLFGFDAIVFQHEIDHQAQRH